MKVVLAGSAGFCWGVSRAADKARKLAGESRNLVYTDGPLIHNDQMMKHLHAEGVVQTDDPRSLRDEILLIRAHGIPPDRRRMLEKLPVTIVDATCPDVAKIQGLIRRYALRGYHVIIFGDVGHAEVIGLLGYAEGNGFVVSQPEDVNTLPSMHPVCLVAQSTQFPLAYGKVADSVRRRFHDAEVLDTICRSTKKRQRELLDIAEKVDAIVVVGASHSANTIRLVEIARTLKPTFHIQTSDQLDPARFRYLKSVGLTSGASTPAFIIEDVKKALEELAADR